jgi:hypothetical protein
MVLKLGVTKPAQDCQARRHGPLSCLFHELSRENGFLPYTYDDIKNFMFTTSNALKLFCQQYEQKRDSALPCSVTDIESGLRYHRIHPSSVDSWHALRNVKQLP